MLRWILHSIFVYSKITGRRLTYLYNSYQWVPGTVVVHYNEVTSGELVSSEAGGGRVQTNTVTVHWGIISVWAPSNEQAPWLAVKWAPFR